MSRIKENAVPIQGKKNAVPVFQSSSAAQGGGAIAFEISKPDTLQLTEPPAAKGLISLGTLYLKKRYEDAKNTGVTAYGYAGLGYDEIKQAVQTGDWNRPYQKLLDPVLDRSVLGPDDAFQDGAGKLGPLLTDRLGIGESVTLGIDAGATIPLEEFCIPNAKLDGGGSLKIARVQKKDAEGNLLSEPKDKNGNPPTELMATVELSGRVGGSYAAKVGFDGSLKLGSREASLNASAGAEAEAGGSGRLAASFAFDPSDEEDMEVLAGLVKSTSSSSFSVSILGESDALSGKLNSHLVSLAGEGGLYAQASARARATAGISKAKDAKDFLEAETLKEKSMSLMAKINTELRVAMMNAGGSVSANLGISKDVRTGENTVYARLDGMLGANGRLPLYHVLSKSIEGSRTLAFTYDEDHNLKGVKIQDEVTKEQFDKGLRSVMEDMLGRPLDKGLIAQIGTNDSVRVTYNLIPSEFESLDAQSLGQALLNKKRSDSVEVSAIHRDVFEVKGAVNLDLGAEIGLRGGIKGSHEQESELR